MLLVVGEGCWRFLEVIEASGILVTVVGGW